MVRGTPGGSGGVGRSSRRSWWGRQAHPEVRDGSAGLAESPVEVERPTQRYGRGREAHPEVRVGSVGPS